MSGSERTEPILNGKGKMKKNQLLLVLWEDSNITHGWRGDEEEGEPIAHCRVVGILKYEDEEKIEVALGDSDCGSKLETIIIAKKSITLIRKLRLA